jgi:hypothetical protein
VQASFRHTAARIRAIAAGNDAFVHVPDALVVAGAFRADFSAFPAEMFVMRRSGEHEMRRCPAKFGAGGHPPEMLRFRMLATRFKAMVHRSAGADVITGKAIVDAILHLGSELEHEFSPFDRVRIGRAAFNANSAAARCQEQPQKRSKSSDNGGFAVFGLSSA